MFRVSSARLAPSGQRPRRPEGWVNGIRVLSHHERNGTVGVLEEDTMRVAGRVLLLFRILAFLAAGVASIPCPVAAQTLDDPGLQIEMVVGGLSLPTTMAFLGPGDILVLQKQDGQVRRVINGVLQPAPVLDVAVNNDGERGLLGIAINTENPPAVFLYYTEADDPGGMGADDGTALGNRLYRYTWNAGAGMLESPVLLLDLPVTPPTAHNGGILVLGPVPPPGPGQVGDGSLLHVIVGDLAFQGQLQNFPAGPPPNDTGIVFRIQQDGTAAPGNPFVPYCSVTTAQPCPGGGGCPMGETCVTAVARYYAYGIRNSFGITLDPATGSLWETENGPFDYDEVNLVAPGMNGGWAKIMGPDSRDPQGTADLFDMPGAGSTYSDPEFSWQKTIAPTAILLPVGTTLGPAYDTVALVGDNNNGQLYRLPLNGTRDGFDFSAHPSLQDLVADGLDGVERDLLRLGSGFGAITDLEVGPDGAVYVVGIVAGRIHRITAVVPTPTPTATPTVTVTPLATPLCAPTPEPCRTPALAAKARILLRDAQGGDRDRLVWKWLKGAATTKAEFADPIDADTYELCLYDGTGLIGSATAPVGGTCNGASCWTESSRGFKYRDTELTPDGLRSIALKEGESENARILVKARGANLAMPNLSALVSPMTVQLKHGNGVCWSARYSFPPALKNDVETFRDRAD